MEALRSSPGIAFCPKADFAGDETAHFFFDASTSWGCGGAFVDAEGTCFFWQYRWTKGMGTEWHINVGETFAGYGTLRLVSSLVPHDSFVEHGGNMVANASARRGASPNRQISEVLRERGLFVTRRVVASAKVYVNTKTNKMADPLSRGDDDKTIKAFVDAARARGAVRFVRVQADEHLRQLERRVSETAERGDSDEIFELGRGETDAKPHTENFDVGEPEPKLRFDTLSGFAGLDATTQAVEPLGGVSLAAFDYEPIVRKIYRKVHNKRCWGNFYNVRKAMRQGSLAGVIRKVLLYTAGTPCPDWSSAGCQRGAAGKSGGKLWLENVGFICEARFPMAILEQVPGILEVDGGRHLREAVARLREAGYLVTWRTRRCNRSKDCTSRTRIFVVAILPSVLRDGVSSDDFFPEESSHKVSLEDIADKAFSDDLVYDGPVKWIEREDVDPTYDGPVLLGIVANGGIGHHVYSANGPVITQKTWGEGPGASTGLYLFRDGTIRRLSPAEAMRTHSFTPALISAVHEMGLEQSELYRLVRNSIPVMALRTLTSHLLRLVDPTQIPSVE